MKKRKHTRELMSLEERRKLLFRRMQTVMALFILLTLALFLVQRSISYKVETLSLNFLPAEQTEATELPEQKPECLILWEDDLQGRAARTLMSDVLSQTKVPYQTREAAPLTKRELNGYQTIVLAVEQMDALGESVMEIMDWTEAGGNLMLFDLPSQSGYLDLILDQLGIAGLGSTYSVVEGLHFCNPFMLGSGLRDYGITDPYESSLSVLLNDDCEVYVESTGEDPVPILWRRPLGEGTVVVSNLDFTDKIYRGFYLSAFSLLGDAFAWPVINGSTFYIDDFPAPVPQGDDQHVTADYGMSVRDFMSQIWWTDIQEMAKEHGYRYTGLVIEQYSDDVSEPLPANHELNRYQYFGRSLLQMGGEIGFHGYNHMPLVLSNFDYRGEYDEYTPWVSMSAMSASLQELNRFCASLYPGEKFQVYVPPSNILSPEGRRMLHEQFPQIKAIASTYLADGVCYDQEFEIAEDGIIETPRIISGYILPEFAYLSALLELNYRFVNTHFQHPDDVLDEDRGADLGWAEMSRRLNSYMDWLTSAAPDIRDLTGTELAGATQRYCSLQVEQTVSKDALTLKLGGLVDEAWLLVRLNGYTAGQVQGGQLTKLQEGLYLLEAKSDRIVIGMK